MNRAQEFVRVAAVAALFCLVWACATRQDSSSPGSAGSAGSPNVQPHASAGTASARANDADAVKILQFYPRDAVVIEGGKTVLCYGVSNARSVRIDPPVEGVGPAFSRCVEVRPKRETRYTLIAEGSNGSTASQSVSVRIATDTASLPKIISFRIEHCVKDYENKPVFSLSFVAQNAEVVSIDPPVFQPLHQSISGEFGVKPEKTTTYTLMATGKNGHVARQQLTLDVNACK